MRNGFVFSDYFESIDIQKTQHYQNYGRYMYMPEITGFERLHFRTVSMMYHRTIAGRSSDDITRLFLNDSRAAI